MEKDTDQVIEKKADGTCVTFVAKDEIKWMIYSIIKTP